MPLDLKPYLVKYRDAGPLYYGKTYDFAKIEEGLLSVRAGRECLRPEHVLDIFNDDKTPFAKYWPRPNKDDLNKIAASPLFLNLSPQQSPGERSALVGRLLAVFYDIGVISIILRFVNPDRFGVISPPVFHLLQVTGVSTPDFYLAYCDELDKWKLHFRLKSVAEAEMAILMLAETIKGEYGEAEAKRAKAEFEQDVWVQRQRVAHAAGPTLRFAPLHVAKILVNENPKLAGMIAGEEYERRLRFASWRFCRCELTCETGAKRKLLDRLEVDRIINAQQRQALDDVWRRRNHSAHAGHYVKPADVEKMINDIEKICGGWDTK